MSNQIKITTSGQYIKVLNFENILAPKIYTEQKINPDINVSIDINGNKLSDTVYEVELIAKITAKYNKEDMFNFNLVYAGIYSISNIENDEDKIKELLFIYCPSLLFPYARRIISDVTMNASLPPLLLDTIDFANLYESKKDQLKKI